MPSPCDDNKAVRMGMIGCGHVGGGVVELLRTQREPILTKTGLDLQLVKVAVRDLSKKRPDHLPPSILTTDPADIWEDPSISIVVELMGGVEPALTATLASLKAGKDVVTANKALLAVHGREIFQAARQVERCVAFEASCAGGIPIIGAVQRGLIANRIDAIYGIVNGTCNYILCQMLEHRRSYAQALAEAQALGLAESDPTLDVDGTDSAHKLAILASLCFQADVEFAKIAHEGIDTLDLSDLQAGAELGYVCKLLAIGRRDPGGLSLRVHPAFLRKDHPLASVSGPFNAVSVYGHAVGHTLYYGRGAGPLPTASAVVADIIDVAAGNAGQMFRQLRIYNDRTPPPTYEPLSEVRTRYYIRLTAADRPGVMAKVTRVFADEHISLSAITQHEPPSDTTAPHVPVVVLTHTAREESVRRALRCIAALPEISETPVCIRIIGEHQES